MSPWWKHHRQRLHQCSRCHRIDRLHDGLCKQCRRATVADGSELSPRSEGDLPPHAPELEPMHDRPWVHRGGA